MNRIGTDAYDKWLAKYRATNIYKGYAAEEYKKYKRNRTPQAFVAYIIQQTREGNENVNKMIVLHKAIYYKKMETKNAMWKAFDEGSDLNDDVKQEIRKFL